jgi:hypothetical protein
MAMKVRNLKYTMRKRIMIINIITTIPKDNMEVKRVMKEEINLQTNLQKVTIIMLMTMNIQKIQTLKLKMVTVKIQIIMLLQWWLR